MSFMTVIEISTFMFEILYRLHFQGFPSQNLQLILEYEEQ